MHKSRPGVVVVDCQEGDFERDVAFWSAALGRAAERSDDPSDQNYVDLESPPGEVKVLLQRVDHPSRAHLDIETDDLEAEVAQRPSLLRGPAADRGFRGEGQGLALSPGFLGRDRETPEAGTWGG